MSDYSKPNDMQVEIKDLLQKLEEGIISEDELRRHLTEFVCKLFDLVICENCQLLYSTFEQDHCPKCGWSQAKHSF